MPQYRSRRWGRAGGLLAATLAVSTATGPADAYDARLDGRWTLQPGNCRIDERTAADKDIGFPTEMRLRAGRLVMRGGGCRFVGFKGASVKNVWSVRLACRRADQRWTASYVYVLRGKRLAVIDRNGLAVSYIRCS
jgi:hypothetical protein